MIYVIVGPTGVGKTSVSVALAKRINAEIISGDSVQVYRELNIGSAKVTSEEMQGVEHHLIDVIDIGEEYSSSVFQKMVRKKIADIESRNKNVIICGGTGYYVKACLYDYSFSEKREDNNYQDKTNEELYQMLKELDPKQAELLHQNNRRRVLRGVEVAEKGEAISNNNNGNKKLYDFKIVGLTMERSLIYERINKRVDLMLENGFMEETKALYPKKNLIHAIGYNELFKYLDGLLSYEDAVELIKQNSRRYAKKQYTWFNNKMDTTWINVENKTAEEVVNEII